MALGASEPRATSRWCQSGNVCFELRTVLVDVVVTECRDRQISKGGGAHSGARGGRTHLELLAGEEVVTEETRLARRAAVVGWCCCRCPPPAAPRRRQ